MSRRVLIVDDDSFFKKLMGGLFNDMGCDVATVGDGAEALKMLEKNGYDLAVLDYHIPGAPPSEITAKLRAGTIETPIVIVTADDTVETERDARALGVAYFFVKPFPMEDLRAVARKVFDSRVGNAREEDWFRDFPG
ncbi:MAG: response regulator [Chitinivibrionales bacterium]|nr:response regulator [Chitinivibrionales bacterium]MBD3357603.1 response regulator [Chitinivibrionales bacterium]